MEQDHWDRVQEQGAAQDEAWVAVEWEVIVPVQGPVVSAYAPRVGRSSRTVLGHRAMSRRVRVAVLGW